ncbi:hypothetical protein BS47DRAFT_1369982 [Hydnum rufescens UP504]|uniref:Uncharacterized protein n=1 Tax=Hydnum rufescens UP504 TaxID=1448309 RepID=A0A9P6ABM3_9AGAM|nr:hypothetical protein BS47DRAFT_1369982 [Hydnum rufescens UP504]
MAEGRTNLRPIKATTTPTQALTLAQCNMKPYSRQIGIKLASLDSKSRDMVQKVRTVLKQARHQDAEQVEVNFGRRAREDLGRKGIFSETRSMGMLSGGHEVVLPHSGAATQWRPQVAATQWRSHEVVQPWPRSGTPAAATQWRTCGNTGAHFEATEPHKNHCSLKAILHWRLCLEKKQGKHTTPGRRQTGRAEAPTSKQAGSKNWLIACTSDSWNMGETS